MYVMVGKGQNAQKDDIGIKLEKRLKSHIYGWMCESGGFLNARCFDTDATVRGEWFQ